MISSTSIVVLFVTLGCISAAVLPPQPVYTIFRSQDELGGYHFGYSGGPASRAEERDHEGIVRGAYNWIDATGAVQKVEYISDALGYRILSGTAIPVAPVHHVVPVVPVAPVTTYTAAELPQPVEETAEVKAARAAFDIKFNEAVAAAASASSKV